MLQETDISSTITATTSPTIIKVRFPLYGKRLSADHGYALYGAISRRLPQLHDAASIGVEMISGVPFSQGIIALPTQGGALYLRLPADRYGEVLPLAGQKLDIENHTVTLGIPVARPLTPASSLYARFVTIKKFTEPDSFLEAANRQLAQLGIRAALELPRDETGRFRRRVMKIKDARIVGFSLAAHDLSDDDSIKLQSIGLGGRRAMGGGIFNAIKHTYASQARTSEGIKGNTDD